MKGIVEILFCIIGVLFGQQAVVNNAPSISAEGWVIIIGAIFIGLTTLVIQVLTLYFNYATNRDKVRRDMIAELKVEQVKKTLETSTHQHVEKLEEVAQVTKATHTLVNSNMGIQLKMNAELARWKADHTSNPKYEQEALLAEKALEEHLEKQKIVDANKEQVAAIKSISK